MYDILVNGQLVGIVIKELVKSFMGVLIQALPEEMSVISTPHQDPKEEKTK